MQFSRLSTLAILALAGVAFQAASAVPTYEPVDPTSSDTATGAQPASSQEQVSRGKDAAQDPTAATQPGTSDSTGSTTTPQPIGDLIHAAAAFDPSTMGRTEPTLPGIATGAPEILYRISNYLPDETRPTLRKVSKAVRNAVDLDPAGRPDLFQRCLYEKWDAFQKDDAVQKLKAAVVSATAVATAAAATKRAIKDTNPNARDEHYAAYVAAGRAKKQKTKAKEALFGALTANGSWTECVTEVYPSATIKPCPHSDYQIADNNREYTAPNGPHWYRGLWLARKTNKNGPRERAFASLLCQLAENDAFYWLKQLVKEAPGFFGGVGLHALIHVVQLTKDKRTAERVQAILQKVSAHSEPIQLSDYYDPVVEHYLFTRNPSLLPTIVSANHQLESGVLTRVSVISNRPLPNLASWYKEDKPTELIMPRVQLPATDNDNMAFMKYLAKSVKQKVWHEEECPVPVTNEFSVPQQPPGPGGAYQLPTLPDQSAHTAEQAIEWLFLAYKDINSKVHIFDMIAGYYTADEAIEFYNAAYKDIYFPSATVMATRSADGTRVLEHVFAHQFGEPGVKLLEHRFITRHMKTLRGNDDEKKAEMLKGLAISISQCAQICSEDKWCKFKDLVADKLSTLTPTQIGICEDSMKSHLPSTVELLEQTAEVKELPDDQCKTFAQRDDCAAHRVVSLLQEGKSAVQIK